MKRIIKGYRNRCRDLWSALRWHAYNLMCAIPFTDLAKSGISRPTDLIKFPWDDDMFHAPSDEEMEDLGRMLKEERARLNDKP